MIYTLTASPEDYARLYRVSRSRRRRLCRVVRRKQKRLNRISGATELPLLRDRIDWAAEILALSTAILTGFEKETTRKKHR